MFTHPDRIGQLAQENHRHMLAQASQRRLGNQHGRSSARTHAAARITRRLAGAITRTGWRLPSLPSRLPSQIPLRKYTIQAAPAHRDRIG
jgi:hypothetical protein